MIITSLIDTDLYKFTMMQVVLHQFPGAQVEYRFKCRNPGVQLARYVGGLDCRSSGANQPHGLCWSLSQAPPGAANARKVEECEQGRGEDPTCGYGSVVC